MSEELLWKIHTQFLPLGVTGLKRRPAPPIVMPPHLPEGTREDLADSASEFFLEVGVLAGVAELELAFRLKILGLRVNSGSGLGDLKALLEPGGLADRIEDIGTGDLKAEEVVSLAVRLGVGDLKGGLTLRPLWMGNSVERMKVVLAWWVERAVRISLRSRPLHPFRKVAKPSFWLVRNISKIEMSILASERFLIE